MKMVARERKARILADYLFPRIDNKIPVSLIGDMGDAWWENLAVVAEVKPPSAETRALVVQYLHDRQQAELEARNAQDNKGR